MKHDYAVLSLSNDIVHALDLIFTKGKYTSKAIQLTLRNKNKWDDEKRRIFSETVYDVVRYWRLLWYILGDDDASSNDKNKLKDLLRVYVLYQRSKNNTLAPADKKKYPRSLIHRLSRSDHIRVIRESIPDWFDDLGVKEMGEQWDSIIHALNQKPLTYIRVNTLKIQQREELIKKLRKEGVQAEPGTIGKDSILIKNKVNLFRLPSFHNGLFEVQDAASQRVSEILEPESGMTIVDACAGEGGKTLHTAALMNNKGKIIALDKSIKRLKELRRRAKRAGADNIETRVIKNSKTIKRLKDRADRLLLDVPCSGTGTLTRNPDIKWKLTINDLKRLIDLQWEILEKYHKIVKVNGRIVYSACSILPSEGERQIKRFLEEHDQFKLLKEECYHPDIHRTDGFYIAVMERYR